HGGLAILAVDDTFVVPFYKRISVVDDVVINAFEVRETCTVANVYVDVALWLALISAYASSMAPILLLLLSMVCDDSDGSSMPLMLSLPLLMACDDSDGCVTKLIPKG
ncbi:hypothetical protein Tco_0741471, partial [Tanacetum coccineum]